LRIWGNAPSPRGPAEGRLKIDELISRLGYVTADMVSLSPDTPRLPDILATFKREHFHTDDEADIPA